MFYTQIFGIPVFLFLNLLIVLLCIIVGSVLAYKINQQNDWIISQIERSIEGQTVGINDQNIELYTETIDIYHTLVPLNQELHRLRMKTQNLTNENYNINDVKVKRLSKMSDNDLPGNYMILLVNNYFFASMMLSAIKESKLEPPLNQQIPILEKWFKTHNLK